MMKKVLAIAISLTMMLGLMACGTETNVTNEATQQETVGQEEGDENETDKTSYNLSFICPNIALPYWSDVKLGLEQADAEFGTTTDFIGPSSIDTEQQIQMMEAAISSGADGIIVAALDATAFEPVINRAVEAGIPVICLDADSPNSKRSSFIGTENTEAGKLMGEALAEVMGGKATIGIITGALDSDNVNQRIDGVKEALEAYPEMEIVVIESANTDLLQATEKTQTMLQAYPEIDAMLGTTSNDMIGAAQIIAEKGKTGEITLINWDDLEETLDLIRSGEIYGTIAQRPTNGGYLAVKNMIALLNGEEIEERIDTGAVLVTKDNVDTYKEE